MHEAVYVMALEGVVAPHFGPVRVDLGRVDGQGDGNDDGSWWPGCD